MGLLSEISSMQAESKERSLLFDMWKILKGDANETVYTEDMRVVVQVILRVIDPKRVVNVDPKEVQESQSASQVVEMNIGFKNAKDQFCIRHCEVQKL
jgi:hypothetical protein